MEKIATDIYTFSKLRDNGFTYVDKTAALHAMTSDDVGELVDEMPFSTGTPR